MISATDPSEDFVSPEFDANGRAYVEHLGLRKTSVAKVKVTKPGTGQLTIRHADHIDQDLDITYFLKYDLLSILSSLHNVIQPFSPFSYRYADRQQVLYPLQFTRLLGLVDVECIVDFGGTTGQAGAIRYALSQCLKSFVDMETVEAMKVCGLLTQDIRVRERKKPGQKGARAKYTWKKR